MSTQPQRRSPLKPSLGLIAAMLLLPLLLLTSLPLLAAVPGALLTAAGIHAFDAHRGEIRGRVPLVRAELVDANDPREMRRIALAERVDPSPRPA